MTKGRSSLQPGLRSPWSLCETVRADLLATLRAVPPSHWARQPGSGRWSVAQQADHLLKAEVGTSKIVRRLIRGDYQSFTRPPDATLYDSRLDAYPFGPAEPRRACSLRAGVPARLYERLAAAHARFFEELQRFATDDPDAIVAPDPASDLWFTLAGWVRVQALHEAHHILQIKELGPERPRPREGGTLTCATTNPCGAIRSYVAAIACLLLVVMDVVALMKGGREEVPAGMLWLPVAGLLLPRPQRLLRREGSLRAPSEGGRNRSGSFGVGLVPGIQSRMGRVPSSLGSHAPSHHFRSLVSLGSRPSRVAALDRIRGDRRRGRRGADGSGRSAPASRRSDVASAAPVDLRPISRGVHGFFGRWLVNGAGRNILRIELSPETAGPCHADSRSAPGAVRECQRSFGVGEGAVRESAIGLHQAITVASIV